jgi:hypothetical protein
MFDAIHEEEAVAPAGSRVLGTIKVVLLLLAAAVLFSYLGAFALTNALVSADLLDHWPPGHDPRPRWMITGFAALTGAFTIIAGWLKWTSWRQMRRLDTIANDDAA